MNIHKYGFEVVARAPAQELHRMNNIREFDDHVEGLILKTAKSLWPSLNWTLAKDYYVGAKSANDILRVYLVVACNDASLHKLVIKFDFNIVAADAAYKMPMLDCVYGNDTKAEVKTDKPLDIIPVAETAVVEALKKLKAAPKLSISSSIESMKASRASSEFKKEVVEFLEAFL